MTGKKEFRDRLSAVRAAYQADWLKKNSEKISGALAAWPLYRKARHIMGYLAFGREVNIDGLLQLAIRQGKHVYVPFVPPGDDCSMRAVEVSSWADVRAGRFGIRTAVNSRPADVEAIELVLVPGLAFTVKGDRMGLGKGYYDAFLSLTAGAVRAGVTLGPQLVEQMPVEEHDRQMDFLITEYGIIACR